MMFEEKTGSKKFPINRNYDESILKIDIKKALSSLVLEEVGDALQDQVDEMSVIVKSCNDEGISLLLHGDEYEDENENQGVFVKEVSLLNEIVDFRDDYEFEEAQEYWEKFVNRVNEACGFKIKID